MGSRQRVRPRSSGRGERAPLPDPRPGPGKELALVQQMFDRVAPRYDLANTVLSLGQDRHWRRVAAKAADPRPGDVLVDVAAGTGALSRELAAAALRPGLLPRPGRVPPPSGGAVTVAVDLSRPMLAAGSAREPCGARAAGRAPLWCNADALRLPLADGRADALTIAFGLRNLPDARAGLAEFARVVRPGGRLLVLEFSRPTWAPLRALYLRYLVRALPAVARLVSSAPAAYRYLADSIQAWPDQEALARLIRSVGWERVRYRNLSGGIVAAHVAERP